MSNLNDVLKLLLENEIEFVLVGGLAGVLHGSSLVTKDVDICALLKPENIQRLRKVLAPYNPKHRMTPQRLSFLDVPDDISNMNNLYLETDLGVLDILTEIKGVGPFARVASKAVTISLFGMDCKVISVDDLISSKNEMGRDKDIAAIKELRVIKDKK